MVKISAAMLVSRYGDKLCDSLCSVFRQRPDSFKCYLDSVKLGENYDCVVDLIHTYNGEPIKQHYDERLSHHENVVNNVHIALLEADYKWLAWCDDDDELLSDRRNMVERHGLPDVGVIHGDIIAFRGRKPPYIRKSRQVYLPIECSFPSIGSGQIYNRDAFKEIHDCVDHGYWWDMKIIYWMMRSGYRSVYIPKLTSIQNVNLNVDEERLKIRKLGWSHELERLEKQSL